MTDRGRCIETKQTRKAVTAVATATAAVDVKDEQSALEMQLNRLRTTFWRQFRWNVPCRFDQPPLLPLEIWYLQHRALLLAVHIDERTDAVSCFVVLLSANRQDQEVLTLDELW